MEGVHGLLRAAVRHQLKARVARSFRVRAIQKRTPVARLLLSARFRSTCRCTTHAMSIN